MKRPVSHQPYYFKLAVLVACLVLLGVMYWGYKQIAKVEPVIDRIVVSGSESGSASNSNSNEGTAQGSQQSVVYLLNQTFGNWA